MSEFYFIDDRGQKQGPFPVEKLQLLITRRTLVWKIGMQDWVKADTVDELSEVIKLIPPDKQTVWGKYLNRLWGKRFKLLNHCLMVTLFSTILFFVLGGYTAYVIEDEYLIVKYRRKNLEVEEIRHFEDNYSYIEMSTEKSHLQWCKDYLWPYQKEAHTYSLFFPLLGDIGNPSIDIEDFQQIRARIVWVSISLSILLQIFFFTRRKRKLTQ